MRAPGEARFCPGIETDEKYYAAVVSGRAFPTGADKAGVISGIVVV